MIERITPYCDDGRTLPVKVGVLCEGEDFDHFYIPERQVEQRDALIRGMLAEMENRERGGVPLHSSFFRKLAEDAGIEVSAI